MSATSNSLKAGTRVNVTWTDGEIYVAEVKKNAGPKAKKVTVTFEDGETASVAIKDVTIRKRGRKSINDEFTNDEIKEQITSLKKRLAKSTDQIEKKAIRRALRRRSHTGGMNKKSK